MKQKQVIQNDTVIGLPRKTLCFLLLVPDSFQGPRSSSVSLNLNFEGFESETCFSFETHPQDDMVEKFLCIRPGFENIPSFAKRLIKHFVSTWTSVLVDSELVSMEENEKNYIQL